MTTTHTPRRRHARASAAETTTSLEDAARALTPMIRALADEIEAGRRLPPALVAAMHGAGLLRMTVPRSLGGMEADPLTVTRVVEELAAADGSTGWCAMIAAQTGTGAAYLPDAEAREVYGAPDAVAAGSLRACGRATPVAGGYRITGRWPFNSGSGHATWFGGECTVLDEAGEETPGQPTPLFYFPRTAVTIHDTWTTTGLRGTASHDFSVEDVFVPAARSYRPTLDAPRHPGPSYRIASMMALCQGGLAIGIARGALEAAHEVATRKTAYGGNDLLRDRPRFQGQYGEAQALVESARAYLHGAGGDLWVTAQRGEDGTPAARARMRLAVSHALRSAVQAVDLLHAALGSAAIFATSPLEQQFRDIHTADAHVMTSHSTVEAAGRVALGLEAGFPFF